MHPSNRSTDDPERGSAALEFIVVGLVLLVPVVYLIVTLGLVQGQSLGAEAAARASMPVLVAAEGLALDLDGTALTGPHHPGVAGVLP